MVRRGRPSPLTPAACRSAAASACVAMCMPRSSSAQRTSRLPSMARLPAGCALHPAPTGLRPARCRRMPLAPGGGNAAPRAAQPCGRHGPVRRPGVQRTRQAVVPARERVPLRSSA
jgi:hypothetical protein